MITGAARRGRGWVCGGLVVVAVFLALAFSPVAVVRAATVTVPDCMGSSLATAISNASAGDTITFAQDCPTATPITLASTQTISKTLTLDGTGHTVVISGGFTVQLFTVNSGVTFAVTGLTLTGGNAVNSTGGAIDNEGGTVTVTNSTLSDNFASYGGGIYNGATLNAANTLIVNSTNGDLYGSGINGTNTHNLTGGFAFATPLQNNGGPTQTLAIPTSGPAYQQGDLATCNAIAPTGTPPGVYDQRGAPRVVGGTCSIGAYEPGLVNTTTALTATPTSAAFGTPVTFTATVRGVRGDTPPDGTNAVTFKNGPTTLGTANLVSGTATFTTSTLPPGNSVTATYGGGNPYAASPASNAVTVTIMPIACVVTSVMDPTESGKLTLRDAVNAANAGACTGNAITFDATAFPAGTAKTITLGNTLALSRDVTIDGTGRQVVVDGGCPTDANSDCTGGGKLVFRVGLANVTLRALTIQHGLTGIAINPGATLRLTNSTLTHNFTSGYGGGIFDSGTLIVTGTTFSGNSASRGGGGIFNYTGTVTVTNSTFSGNSAGEQGGGIETNPRTTLTVTNSTFANNSAPIGGGIFNDNAAVTVTNTILAGNPGSDVYNYNNATTTDGGHNLVSDASLAGGTGDKSGPALLAPLGSYGGSTQTFALLPGSAALGGGDPLTCAAALPAGAGGADQRGVARPDAGTTACDIGAFESQGFTLAKTSGDGQSVVFGTPFAPLTATVTSKDSGVTVNGGTLTFAIVPGSGSATFGAPAARGAR